MSLALEVLLWTLTIGVVVWVFVLVVLLLGMVWDLYKESKR